jgi:chromosome segregation ATPase
LQKVRNYFGWQANSRTKALDEELAAARQAQAELGLAMAELHSQLHAEHALRSEASAGLAASQARVDELENALELALVAASTVEAAKSALEKDVGEARERVLELEGGVAAAASKVQEVLFTPLQTFLFTPLKTCALLPAFDLVYAVRLG